MSFRTSDSEEKTLQSYLVESIMFVKFSPVGRNDKKEDMGIYGYFKELFYSANSLKVSRFTSYKFTKFCPEFCLKIWFY